MALERRWSGAGAAPGGKEAWTAPRIRGLAALASAPSGNAGARSQPALLCINEKIACGSAAGVDASTISPMMLIKHVSCT